jgi:hypothetical protein
MPFSEPRHYVHDLQRGALVEFQGRPLGRVEGVVPQADGVHIWRVIATLDAPHNRLVALPMDWLRITALDRVVVESVSEQQIADWPTHHPFYAGDPDSWRDLTHPSSDRIGEPGQGRGFVRQPDDVRAPIVAERQTS